MIMKCCGCHQKYSQKCAREDCQTEYLKVFGGGKRKVVKNNVSYDTVKKIYGDKGFQNSLLKILNNNKNITYTDLIDDIKVSISYMDKRDSDVLRLKILYISIDKELQNISNKDAKIDYGKVIEMLKKSFDNIISELTLEQACINEHMEDFKTTFKDVDFVKLSDDFLKSSTGNKMNMLAKYCKLEIALNDPNIIAEQLNLKWFAKNFINKQSKISDDIHNEDDDAFLLYYLNEVNKDK